MPKLYERDHCAKCQETCCVELQTSPFMSTLHILPAERRWTLSMRD